jgi:hypothetical protein
MKELFPSMESSASVFPWRDNMEILAESLETLCTVEMTSVGPGRGIVRPLFEAASEAQGGFPMLRAARSLVERVEPGSIVILSTGIVIPDFMPYGESDGPPGIAALAWILAAGLNATPLILCESETVGPLKATIEALGLPVRSLEAACRLPIAVAIQEFTEDDARAPGMAKDMLDELGPAAVIVSEKLGVNRVGVPHTSTGKPLSGKRARLEVLVELARASGITTIGVGDNGNEIGFGLIPEAVERFKPYGKTCQCACGSGLASANATDHLIVATVSNWGCYGLTAMVAGLINRPDLIPDSSLGMSMIRACAAAGAVDGANAMQSVSVDGIPAQVEAAMLDMMIVIVKMGLAVRPARKF